MPGRYFITTPESAQYNAFPAEFDRTGLHAAFATPRYNIAPTQHAPVLRVIDGELVASDMRWGFAPRWVKDAGRAQINARSETMFEKPMFRQAAMKQRCLVPASGWYEWQPTESGKQPYALHREAFEPFAFAGLWTVGNDESGGPEENFLTLTTEPSPQVAAIHHRMPVILDAEGCRLWLDASATQEQLTPLLVPWAGRPLVLRRISTKVNSPKNHGPECLQEIGKGT